MTIPPLPDLNSGDWYGWAQGVDGAARTPASAPTLAPAPSGDATGATDQAALQPLITSVQANGGGIVQLRAGTYYVTGLATSKTAIQPRIIGQGRTSTILSGVGSGTLVQFNGNTSMGGGYIGDLTLAGGTGVALEIIASGGTKWERLLIDGPFSEGIRFNNNASGEYTEFCSGSAEFSTAMLGPAIRYKNGGGNLSFHGSGLTEGSIINHPYGATWPAIQIDALCRPYNAPLTVQIFGRVAGLPLIRNQNTTDYVNFRGELTVEQFVDNCVISDPAASPIWYTGSLNAFGHAGLTVGNVKFVDRIWNPTSPGYPVFVRRPYAMSTPLAAGATAIATFDQRSSYLVSVRITDAGGTVYYYDQLLYVVLKSHEGDGKGSITTLATTVTSPDTGSIGAPVYSLNANVLTVTNSGFSSALTAQVGVTPVNPWVPLT